MDAEVKQAVDEVSQAIKELKQKFDAHLTEPSPTPSPAGAHLSESAKETLEQKGAHSTESAAQLQEVITERDQLRDRVAVLESETHLRRVVQDWMRGLTAEGYVELGVKLGYTDLLAEALPEGDPDAIHETALSDEPGSPRILFSETLPEGEDGWVKSEVLGCFVKAE